VVVVHSAFEPFLREARANPEPTPSSVTTDERRQAFRDEALAMQGEMAPMTSLEDRELVLEGRTLMARLYVPVNEEAQAV
jgi:hypothetical protein